MSSRSVRLSVLAVMLSAIVGCDSNSGAPSAPTTPVPNASKDSEGGLKGIPKTGGKQKQVEGPKPTPID